MQLQGWTNFVPGDAPATALCIGTSMFHGTSIARCLLSEVAAACPE